MTRAIYRITGADRESFLQGLVSNDVKKLKNGLVYAALLTPQGKYLADFFLVPGDEAILLDVDAAIAASTIQRLSMYKLRADVEIAEAPLHVHRGLGAPPEDGFADPRHPALGWRAYRTAPMPANDDSPDLSIDDLAALPIIGTVGPDQEPGSLQ